MAEATKLYPAGFMRFLWPVLLFQIFLFVGLWALAGPYLFDSPDVMRQWQWWFVGIHVAPIIFARIFSGPIHTARSRRLVWGNFYEIFAWLVFIGGAYWITWNFAGPESAGVQDRLNDLPRDAEGRRIDAIIYLVLLVAPTVGWLALFWGQVRQLGRPLRFSLPKLMRWLRVLAVIMLTWLAGIPLYAKYHQTTMVAAAGWPMATSRHLLDADREHAQLAAAPGRIIMLAGKPYLFSKGYDYRPLWSGENSSLSALGMTVYFSELAVLDTANTETTGNNPQRGSASLGVIELTLTSPELSAEAPVLPPGTIVAQAQNCIINESLLPGLGMCYYVETADAETGRFGSAVPATRQQIVAGDAALPDGRVEGQPAKRLRSYLVTIDGTRTLLSCVGQTCRGQTRAGDLTAEVAMAATDKNYASISPILDALPKFVEEAEVKDADQAAYLIWEQGALWEAHKAQMPAQGSNSRDAAFPPLPAEMLTNYGYATPKPRPTLPPAP